MWFTFQLTNTEIIRNNEKEVSITVRAILSSVVFSFLLVGCQNSGPSETSPNSSNNNSETQNSTLPIEKTEYGRGAQSDGADTNAQEEPTRIISDDTSSIIIYFSRSGNTQNLARMIYNEAGGDMLELTPESVISHQKIGFLSGFFNIYTSWFINRL